MFESHFHMTRLPFCEFVNAQGIHKDERFSQAMARLQYFSLHGGLAMITGVTGVGKSTLIKLFINSLARNFVGAYIHITQLRSSSLLKLIALQMGQKPQFTKEKVFTQILDKARSSDLTYILLIDEAQLIVQNVLTDLRLLISCALDDAPPLKIVLVGQDSLKANLEHPDLADLYHRVNVRYQLKPLNKNQTISYIDAQLRSAGANTSLFTSDVKDMIFDLSHGIPRQINQIATVCLLNAASRNLHKIDEVLFSETMNEFHLQ